MPVTETVCVQIVLCKKQHYSMLIFKKKERKLNGILMYQGTKITFPKYTFCTLEKISKIVNDHIHTQWDV